MSDPELTAGDLAELTGVAPGTLRVWETRHGFPRAQRLSGNRKRYSQSDVEQVRAVLEHRAAGLSLAAAIRRARDELSQPPDSMFAALRAVRPDLAVRMFPKAWLIALSHAIEDEQAAHSTGGVVIGSFQHERYYRASERRWRALARTADLAVVMADFQHLRDPPDGPVEVPLSGGHPLGREWTVVVHSPGASACLAAWEVPSPRPLPDPQRRFEFVWTCDPAATRAAVLAASQTLSGVAPGVARRIPDAGLGSGTPTEAHQRFSDELASRAFAYLSAAAQQVVADHPAVPVPRAPDLVGGDEEQAPAAEQGARLGG